MNDLGQDNIDQLAFWQREIRIMIAGKDVAVEKCYPDLCHQDIIQENEQA